MTNSTTVVPVSSVKAFIGLDVHKDSISGAVIPAFGPDIVERFQIPNTPEAVAKIVARLASPAGPGHGNTHNEETTFVVDGLD